MPPDLNSLRSVGSCRIFHSGKDKDVGNRGLVSLPAHVNTVKDGLLDFNRFLGLEATMLVLGDKKFGEDEEDDIPLSAYKTDGLSESQRAREIEFFEDAQELVAGAGRFENGFDQDGEWRRLFRTVITNRAKDVHYSGSHLPNIIGYTENEVWDTGFDPSRPLRTSPKPDLYFGFPVHNTEGQKIYGFRNDPSFQNYTVDTLSQLAMKGLRCIPVSGFLTDAIKLKRDNTELEFPLLCFPWCIVQQKGAEKAATVEENNILVLETSCQASTAASCSLAMFEKLARFADVKESGQHIPPLITITCVGLNATVWLAFSDNMDDQYRDHTMLSIWSGCMSKLWDAIQFCHIIDNLFFWSQHILRPKVSHYIDQWRLRYCPEVHNLHSRLEKDLETAELIHRVQDRLSSLSISPNSNLPEPIQQAVVFQEVMRSNPQKTEPAPKERPGPNNEDEIESSKKVLSHPKVDASAAGASSDDVTEGGEKRDSESKEEDGKKKDHLDGDSGDTCYFAESQDKPTLQPKSPEKNGLVFTDLPVNYKKPTYKDSTDTKNNQGRRSTNTKCSTATNFTFPATPSKPPTDEHVSKSKPPTNSYAKKGRDSKSFSYPYEFKTSGFEFQSGRFLSHSDKSKSADFDFKKRQPRMMASRVANRHILPLRMHHACKPTDSHQNLFGWMRDQRSPAASKEPTTSEKSALRKNSNNRSRSTNTSSVPPNPFIATSFGLSFDVNFWWDMTLAKIPPQKAPLRQDRPGMIRSNKRCGS
ncbi:MAG: hypothetical protein M1834_001642 [Cirrosporium novae-zelandiae]|nr:MAG: hypothetical protein M1834_004159 [Cirrosporium novae-zelandiae]KAI9735626.1 MAG: hypothetical protein M1834_001642 [Cirrosporium novae-zelandiae]